MHFPSLQYVECLINYGIGYNAEFEKEFNKSTNAEVYAFDPTIKKLKFFVEKIKNGEYVNTFKQFIKLLLWVYKEKNLKNYKIHFIEEGLSAENNELFKSFDYHLSRYNLHNSRTIYPIFSGISILKSTNFQVIKLTNKQKRLIVKKATNISRLSINLFSSSHQYINKQKAAPLLFKN